MLQRQAGSREMTGEGGTSPRLLGGLRVGLEVSREKARGVGAGPGILERCVERFRGQGRAAGGLVGPHDFMCWALSVLLTVLYNQLRHHLCN